MQHARPEVDMARGHRNFVAHARGIRDQHQCREDDEVLEGLGNAARQEIALLNAALRRIEDGTYGICQSCGGEISIARLEAVPHAMLCRECANAASSRGT